MSVTLAKSTGPPAAAAHGPKRSFLLGACLAAAAVAAYLPAFGAGFVWDDDLLVDETAQTPDSEIITDPAGLYRIWLTGETMDYWPIRYTVVWIQYRLWGTDPAGYHAVNVFLHAAACLLLWRTLRRWQAPGAYLAGLLLAVHPVAAAVTAWASQVSNILALIFLLLAAMAARGIQGPHPVRGYLLTLAAFTASLLSKTTAVAAPVFALGCLLVWRRPLRLRVWLGFLPFLLVCAAMAAATVWFDRYHASAGSAVRDAGLFQRIATAGWAVWFYLGKALMPVGQSMLYPLADVDPRLWWNWLPLAGLAACPVVLWRLRNAWAARAALLGLGFFVVSLLPVIGLIDTYFMLYSLVSDHLAYLPLVGVAALAAAFAQRGLDRLQGRPRTAAVVAGILLLGALGALTWQRARVFQGHASLWADTVAKHPRAWVAYNNLGMATKAPDQAAALYRQALAIKGDYALAHNNLGTALCAQGDIEGGIACFERALQISPTDPLARDNLAYSLLRLGLYGQAVAEYRKAIATPRQAKAHHGLGQALLNLGRPAQALEQFREALRLRRDKYPAARESLKAAQAHLARAQDTLDQARRQLQQAPSAEPLARAGAALTALGRHAEAADAFLQAATLQPADAGYRLAAGNALAQAGLFAKAAGQMELALQREPDKAPTLGSLAWLLATCPDDAVRAPGRALELAGRAVELAGRNHPNALDTLAAAQAAASRFDLAARTARAALQAARAAGDNELVKCIRGRLWLYGRSLPYRQGIPADRK